MSHARRIARSYTVPPLQQGFAGPGHLAAPVLRADGWPLTDPFIMLMDDHLDMGEGQVGGAHPHAGFETVTLVLDGTMHDPDEGGLIRAGEVQWMTAGRGIVHNENAQTTGKVRLLQLWLTLPKAQRWTEPGFQDVRGDRVPVRREPGVEARVYSGASGGMTSPTRNHVPVTMVEFRLEQGASVEQELPASDNGFVFVLEGAVRAGDDGTLLSAGQVGWLDRPESDRRAGPVDPPTSTLRLAAGDAGARLVLYAGQPQGDAIVSHGPFIGDTPEDIKRLYAEYRAGRFARMSEIAAPARAR